MIPLDDPAILAVLARVETAATLFMTGLVWFVQRVHYPLFAHVGAGSPSSWTAYERCNTRRTGTVVIPVMLVEAAAALARAIAPGADAATFTGLALLAAVWLSTVLLQIPAHARLERGFDAAVHRRLVRSNWIRTAAWTARSVLLVAA